MFGFLKQVKDKLDDVKTSIEQTASNKESDNPKISTQDAGDSYRKHLNDYHPSANGLYPDEILMLSMATKYKTSNNEFQKFWGTKYYIDNPQKLLTSLESKGFIQQIGLKDSLLSLKTNDLKAELSAKGLDESGKKEVLVERLLENVDNTILESKFPNKSYILTELGDAELKQNEYVPYLHANSIYDVGIWDMNHLLYFENPKHLGYRDILWKKFMDDSILHYGNGAFYMCRKSYYFMYRLVMEEKKYEAAFNIMCEILYMDLSGMRLMIKGKYDMKNRKKYFLKMILDAFPYNSNDEKGEFISLPHDVSNEWLPEMKSHLQFESDEAYYVAILEKFKQINDRYEYHVFTPEESAYICIWEMNKDTDKLIEVYKQAETRLQKKVDELQS